MWIFEVVGVGSEASAGNGIPAQHWSSSSSSNSGSSSTLGFSFFQSSFTFVSFSLDVPATISAWKLPFAFIEIIV